MTLWIDNEPILGKGEQFSSIDPVSQAVLWQGCAATKQQVEQAVQAARHAFEEWRQSDFSLRKALVERFAAELEQQADSLAISIAKETGKPLWESQTEVAAMVAKVAISVEAYHERTGSKDQLVSNGQLSLRHYPLGVMAVLGPYNFPAHLPNGHIVPALLSGNTIVFKPSELTPMVAEQMMQIWLRVGLPKGVINLVQGARKTGEALLDNQGIDAVLFTGSAQTGQLIHKKFAGKPEKMLALEMGGNNPMVVAESYGELDAAVYTIIQSAFISSGQRCTCARRLFIANSPAGDSLLARLVEVTQRITQGQQFADPAPFMGSLISEAAAQHMMDAQQQLVALGARPLLQGKIIQRAMVTPAILDVTDIANLPDEEYFAPLLQVIRYQDFAQAISMANATRFGLSAGLIATDDEQWRYFFANIRAGIINRNSPLTGASSRMPFGGVGASGNLRPSAYYAADYCAYPVASMQQQTLGLPSSIHPGINLQR